MKKVIYFLAAMAVVAGLASCKCTRDNNILVPEKTIAVDSVKVAEIAVADSADYVWYETSVEYDNFFDEDTTFVVSKVASVFQEIKKDSTGIDTKVYVFTHELGVEDVMPDPIDTFVIEDMPLDKSQIVLTFADAMGRMYMANYPKPHSRQVVLRKEVGPKPGVNPQYIFGNTEAQLYVDAVTGDVTDTNPVFDFEKVEVVK